MKKGISLAPIAHFFHRYHLILFVLTVVIGVSSEILQQYGLSIYQ